MMQDVRNRLWDILIRVLARSGVERGGFDKATKLEDVIPTQLEWRPVVLALIDELAVEEHWSPAAREFAKGVADRPVPLDAPLDLLVSLLELVRNDITAALDPIVFSEPPDELMNFETELPGIQLERIGTDADDAEDAAVGGGSDEDAEEEGRPLERRPPPRLKYKSFGLERSPRFGVPMASATENTVRTRIFYATDRKPLPDPVTKLSFQAERSDTLTLGECEVTFPAKRQVGDLPRPRWWRFEFKPDPNKHAMLREVVTLGEQAFYEAVRERLAAGELREAFVFVHGFNVGFESAALRTAQLAMDLKFDGAPILYSWPSNGTVQDYIVDHNNVTLSAAKLSTFLANLAHRSGADRVHVIAHSMGNQALCEALHSLSEKGAPGPVVHHVAMAAPDVDADLFRQMSQGICQVAGTVTLYASSKDKAIRASRQVNGHPRAGEPLLIVGGVDTVDASSVDTDFLSHGYFSDDRSVLEDLYTLLRGIPASSRFNLASATHPSGQYYVFRA